MIVAEAAGGRGFADQIVKKRANDQHLTVPPDPRSGTDLSTAITGSQWCSIQAPAWPPVGPRYAGRGA